MDQIVKLSDDTRLFVRDQGTGPAILWVHGFPFDGSMWDAQREAFSSKYRVIIPDLPGFGRSTVPNDQPTMAGWADDLAQMLDILQVDGQIVLAGLSMGGYVAWEFLRRHRQRLGALILLNTRAEADTPEVAKGRQVTANKVLHEGLKDLADTMATRLFSPSTRDRSRQIIEACHQRMMQQPPGGMAAALHGMAQREDLGGELSKITVPTLVIAGQHDRITPAEEMEHMANQITGATFTLISDAGHLTPVEQPEEVNRVIDEFLVNQLRS